MSSSSSSDMNFMDLLFSREDAFLKDVVKDEPFVDHNYTDDAITVSFKRTVTTGFINDTNNFVVNKC